MKREVFSFDAVAPARERGLKFVEICDFDEHTGSRSRKGAWIEIMPQVSDNGAAGGRSRKGAWIEILLPSKYCK